MTLHAGLTYSIIVQSFSLHLLRFLSYVSRNWIRQQQQQQEEDDEELQ